MAEYINREALISDLEKSVVITCRTKNVPQMQRVLERFINCIKDQPTADVAEVKHGEWIPCGDGEHTPLMCSSCLNTWGFYKKRGSDYCPLCGAKMDK